MKSSNVVRHMGFHHGTMGLTDQESATINQVAGQLNMASEMHKGQAEKLRNLGFTPNAKNLVENYEPTNQEMSWFRGKAKNLHNALHTNKGNLGYANFGNSENIQFVATEVLKFTGILVGGMLLLGVPAYMLVNNPKLKNKSEGELKTLLTGFIQQPVRTSLWWAGGSSVLIGAKDNKPKQMGAGAALMAASAALPLSGRARK